MRKFRNGQHLALLVVGMTAATAAEGAAATIAALKDGRTIVWIDTDQKKVTGSATLQNGASLVGFDVRPADGKVYGLSSDGAIVTVDVKTGAWQKVSQLSAPLPTGTPIAVDFNPVADRLRVIAGTGLNLRVNVADGMATVDGTLKYAAGAATSQPPMVAAAAYTNSVAGAKETALYDIDVAAASLVKQAPPNDGVLATVGTLGVTLDGAAFDVWSDGMGKNIGWLVSGGTLHMVDLATGKATAIGPITGLDGRIADIAILPAM